jgi:hypothetical protein
MIQSIPPNESAVATPGPDHTPMMQQYLRMFWYALKTSVSTGL